MYGSTTNIEVVSSSNGGIQRFQNIYNKINLWISISEKTNKINVLN